MTELEKLVEKDAIRDQYYVYARALDRIDNPLGKTVFAEDAQVDYGPTYKGTGYGFIDMMQDAPQDGLHAPCHDQHSHQAQRGRHQGRC